MRFIVALNNITTTNSNVIDNTDNNAHIYDKTLYDKYMLLSKMYDTDESLCKLSRKITIITHPFELIGTTVKSSFIPNCPDLKITNAYMKMWEFLKFITNDLKIFKPTDEKLRMYDVAGAPGMFIIATECFLKKYFPKTKLDWHTCSLEGGTALQDVYTLFKSNPERYQPCDVTKPDDIKNCMKKGKFTLVTGDIGIFHEDNWNKLQEEDQLDIEWGQMILALNLVENGGIMFLKMYSYVTYENVFLLDTLTKYFEKVYICKPYTSRLLNAESYIICINRNNNDCMHEPLTRPIIKIPYESENLPLIKSFEFNRLDVKYRMISFIKRILERYPHMNIQKLLKNKQYYIYYREFEDLFNELNDKMT